MRSSMLLAGILLPIVPGIIVTRDPPLTVELLALLLPPTDLAGDPNRAGE